MAWTPSRKMQDSEEDPIRRMAQYVNDGTIRLDIGEPDVIPPKHMNDRIKRAMDQNKIKYSPTGGLKELRELIAGDYSQRFGRTVKPGQIVVTTGATEAISSTIAAYIDPGDRVLYSNPYFPKYTSLVKDAGAVPIPLNIMTKGEHFDVCSLNLTDLCEAVEKHKPKLMIVNSPGNPAGNVECKKTLEGVLEICKRNNVGVIADEIYNKYVYEGNFVPMGSLSEEVATVDGISKVYAMTGWRLGYLIAPSEEVAKNVSKIQSDRTTCPNTAAQYGLIGAYENPDETEAFIKETNSEFRRRRDAIVGELNNIEGIRCSKPEGAFYTFPNIEGTGMTSQQLSDLLVSKANVTAVPGNAFGESGEGFMRFAYTKPVGKILEATRRIKIAVENVS